jgi:hypothetical protein
MQAFIGTIKAPLYPRAIDRALAASGKDVFLTACAGCHGTYASDPLNDARDTYPNLLIPLDVIGTDPVVAELERGVDRTPLRENAFPRRWFRRLGEIARVGHS